MPNTRNSALKSYSGRRTIRRMKSVNLAETFARFSEHWTPKIVGELNGQHVKLVKVLGEFVWHHHESEDELFLVISGSLRMGLPR